jgi:hypothetical protein
VRSDCEGRRVPEVVRKVDDAGTAWATNRMLEVATSTTSKSSRRSTTKDILHIPFTVFRTTFPVTACSCPALRAVAGLHQALPRQSRVTGRHTSAPMRRGVRFLVGCTHERMQWKSSAASVS